MLVLDPYVERKKTPKPRVPKPDSELISIPYYYLNLTPGHVDLFGNYYWEWRSPWREGKPPLNTGVAPRNPIRVSLSDILEPNPDPKYYLTTTACLGILRRAAERGKELPAQLKMALMIQAGLIDDPYTPSEMKAYHINQRDEGIDLNGVSGALMATNNMQMQTFVTQSEPSIGFDGYNGDLTGDLSATLGVNCGMSTGRNGVIAPMAFAANQRDEVRDLNDVAGALGAQPGMKQQTFIAEGVVTKGNGDCFLTREQHTSLSTGGGQAGQGYPCVLTAGFSAGQGAKAGGIGYSEELSPTLKASESGTNMVPSILCLNDQGGKVMSCSEDISGTLRAQEHGHQPLVVKTPEERDARLIFTGNILQGTFCESEVAGALMANQNKCYNNIVLPRVFGQQSYAHYAEGFSTLAATGGTLGGGGENLVVNEPPMLFENHGIDSRYTGPHSVSPTMSARYGTGGNNVPLISQNAEVFCITGNAIDRQPQNGGNGIGYQEDLAYTLTATDHHAVYSRQRVDVFRNDDVASTQSARQHKDATDLVMDVAGLDCRNATENGDLCGTLQKGTSGSSLNSIHPIRHGLLIRRLTPLECERLQ